MISETECARGCVFSGKNRGTHDKYKYYILHTPFTISEIAAFLKECLRLRALSDKNGEGMLAEIGELAFRLLLRKSDHWTNMKVWEHIRNVHSLFLARVYKPVLLSQLTSHFSVVEVIRKTT